QEIKSDSNFSDGIISGDKEENYCPVRDEIVTEGDTESTKDVPIIESSSEPVGLSARNEEQSHNISESSDCAGFSQCLEQDVTEENQSSSPLSSTSHSSITRDTKEQDIVTDVSARPSPVSVLDAPFLEDDATSANSRCQPGKHPCTQPYLDKQLN
ncbi:phosphatidylinositol N-acetyglucosaminlytransferase subunit P-like, partial [Trifolium medium]|nr:phosphatidylinositol N-acetyglucosaminlytransferase subunit P-like [Trifolium medium]